MNICQCTGIDHRRNKGLTVIELMITLSVAAVLIVGAVPSVSPILHKNRIQSAASHLNVSLNLARGEAVKRNIAVRVCPDAEDGWSGGWSVVSVDCDGVVLRQVDARSIHSYVSIEADPAIDSWVQFNPTGDSAASGQFRICHADSVADSQAVDISRVGRVEVFARDRSDCGTGEPG